ncbi:kinesin-like protein KIF16B isoform X2 [Gouania willdenowi]|uniref:kinesin-like protein KIF16B isoform X2 n=1 Tax=Gouania willdenowi TaxID=441366 RepID=UPI001054BA86|nr:kinesin-like protein KIF16B isoform X2 [Gouania willdenowi]
MASVRVAVRVRPINKREKDLSVRNIITMDGNTTSIINPKVSDDREKTKTFNYDFSYDSYDSQSPTFASQDKIFGDLGSDVLKAAFEGYNACVFAYGQTGSGKSYTMMGSPGDVGLIPRICEALFSRVSEATRLDEASFRTEVSYLEIYTERVRDLLRRKSSQTDNLRIREHPKDGPYVEGLSKHLVQNFGDVEELMEAGNIHRTTASTGMNDVSSRSHAIFTIKFTQAKFDAEMPIETLSKIHLVDLAGSERADATGATGLRLKEGGNINKSLVTLGNVISALDGDDGTQRRRGFVPYRDSVLTWLLRDSLGGNSKTIMIATVSPADVNYGETLSTLRYANRAKNIINKPTINEDANVRLIRELRAEIARLKALLVQGNQVALLDSPTALSMEEKLHQNEARVLELTKEWTNKWNETQNILKEQTLALRKEGIGVILDSELPHLIGIDDDLLSTGIILYHLKEGQTFVGRVDANSEQDIILHGVALQSEHCMFDNRGGTVTLVPLGQAQCSVNGALLREPATLTQGAVILLGRTNMFRFNHPKEAAKLREKRKSGLLSSLSLSMCDLSTSCDNLSTVMLYNPSLELERQQREELEKLELKRRVLSEIEQRQRMERAELERLLQDLQQRQEAEPKNQTMTSDPMDQRVEQVSVPYMQCLTSPTDERHAPPPVLHHSTLTDERINTYIEEEVQRRLSQMNHVNALEQSMSSVCVEDNTNEVDASPRRPKCETVNQTQVLDGFSDSLRMGRGWFSCGRDMDQRSEDPEETEKSLETKGHKESKLLQETETPGEPEKTKVCEEPGLVKVKPLGVLRLCDVYRGAGKQLQETRDILRNIKDGELNLLPFFRHDPEPAPSISEPGTDLAGLAIDRYTTTFLTHSAGSVSSLRDLRPQMFLQHLVDPPLSSSDMMNRMKSYPSNPLSVFWLQIADLKQPVPEAACVVLSGKDVTVVSGETWTDLHRFSLQEVQEVQIGLGGQYLRLLDVSEDVILVVFTYSKELSQDVCKALLGAFYPEGLPEGVSAHPLLSSDLMVLSLDWKSNVSDMVLGDRRVSSRFQRVLADLVYVVHGNMQSPDKPSLADVRPLLYTSVKILLSPEDAQQDIVQLLVTDSHLALLQEDAVFHPVPARSAVVPTRPQFQVLKVQRCSDVRCVIVQQKEDMLVVDVIFPEMRRQSDVLPQCKETWTLTFGSTAEAHTLIGCLCPSCPKLSLFGPPARDGPGRFDPIRVSIPRYVLRGQGKDEHFEFEVKINVGDETWTVFRRYSRFREMHHSLKSKYPEVSSFTYVQ